MRAKALVALVVEPSDSGVLDRAVHAFDLTVGPWMVEFRQAMIDAVLRTGQVERMGPKRLIVGKHPLNLADAPTSLRRGELKAVVGEHGVDPVRDAFDEPAKEVRRNPAGRACMELCEGELADPVDGHKQIELALLGPDLRKIDVYVANGIGLGYAEALNFRRG